MSEQEELLSIKEASIISGVSIPTLYKHIKSGIISENIEIIKGRKTKKIKKEELVKVYNLSDNIDNINDNQGEREILSDNIIEYERISDIIKENMEDFFKEKETALIKPMEEQAIFIAGGLTKENKFLQEKNETLLQEISELKEQIKALPDLQQVEAMKKEKEEQENKLHDLETRLEEQEKKAEELQEEKEQEEKNLLATIEELKKRLEEEEKRPWWKKIF